ncbi:MAG: C1 family peptidase [Bacteroidota bacterium]
MNRSALILSLFLLPLSLCAQQSAGGLLMDDVAYQKIPLQTAPQGARIAGRASLKQYAPRPQDQGHYNNCVGWAVAYGARTILFAQEKDIREKSVIQHYAFSPSFTYKLISKSRSCNEAVSIEAALASMEQQGAALKRQVPETCVNRLYSKDYSNARRYKIGGYSRLFYRDARDYDKIRSVKYAIAQGQPVIIGMNCTPSFENAENKNLWRRTESSHTRNYFGHALVVVAYDNEKYGGSFQLMNSWGTKWGNDGFIWIKYEDFADFTKYGYAPSSLGQAQRRQQVIPISQQSSPIRGFLPFLLLYYRPRRKKRWFH